MCMAERRRRCKSIIASPGSPGHSTKYLGEVGQKASPPEVEPNAPPWTESATLTSTGFIRPQESTLASKTRTAFGVLREILLALDGHNTSASEPLIFPKRLLTPCLQSATGVNNRAEVDGKQLYRRTFICSPDKDEITQSALTEIQVLLRFRDPGLPILLGYTYAEDPDNPGTIRLELFTQWHEMRSIASWIQSTQPVEWNINARIQVLYKLAKTLDFLLTNQSAYVFHQNLCTRTVVLQSQCHPILVDFTKALIINKETDKTVSIQEANQSGAILCGQRKDVMGFAKVCLEVWSHKLWEDTQHNDDLTDMIKEEKLTLVSGCII
ncbi:hypothetical protein D915_008044 [Fasciola hepatica]|uniref:Protein kinase domain-containing protein n=1 Tax=Fasciola hepatica TaxID=6192 RepID=A0A4E0RIM1_FASHE|nr:hypothetical protein D915_008044 [Fasciola hepatica]